MTKILICGNLPVYKNYAVALSNFKIDYDITYQPKDFDYSGLILCGGGDILIDNLKHLSMASNINPVKDRLEFNVLEYFCMAKLPILGICKGMQMINSYFGGFCCNISNPRYHASNNRDKIHIVTTIKEGFLHKIYGDSFKSNSAHHQKIKVLGDNLKISAVSYNNTIEAIEHCSLPIIGCQFHPERMNQDKTANGLLIFEYFLSLLK